MQTTHMVPRSSATSAKRQTLNIRIQAHERILIDRAAQVRGKNRTDFILDAARLAAEEALLDSAMAVVSPKAHAQILARLDLPPNANPRLRQTLQTPPPWACCKPPTASAFAA